MENIRPIKTEADYDWAIAEITRYFENEPEVGSADGDRFDVLATLIEAYEDKHYPIEAPDPVEAIRSHMELFKLSRKALADVIGSSPRGGGTTCSGLRAVTPGSSPAHQRSWR